ncbi:hypothetical protein NOCA2270093 [metagenome]|uniref:Uncharacterized protein n=1 Tax=metagenome TaxID=256318 RepID=A0A2P2C0A7_9ZZZZ
MRAAGRRWERKRDIDQPSSQWQVRAGGAVGNSLAVRRRTHHPVGVRTLAQHNNLRSVKPR